MWERKLAGQDANGGAQPMDIGQIDKSEGEDEDVNAVQQRRPNDRSTQKHEQEFDNERKPFNRRTANSSPSAPRQSTPRNKNSRSGETKQCAGKKKTSLLPPVWWKGPSCQALPIRDEVGTEPSSDADSFVWIGSMTPLRPLTQCPNGTTELVVAKETPAFVDSGAAGNVLPNWKRLPCRRAELVSKEQTGHTSSTLGSGAFKLRQAPEAISTPRERSQMC